MMQGAGGLWSCMDDMAKLGDALGRALQEKSDVIGQNGLMFISRQNLQVMVTSQAVNASCGLAMDAEGGPVIAHGSDALPWAITGPPSVKRSRLKKRVGCYVTVKNGSSEGL